MLYVDEGPGEHKRPKALLEARSSNHFTLAFTEFEFLIDFGQAYEEADTPIVHSRITMTPQSASTLFGMLGELLTQYESSVGPISKRPAGFGPRKEVDPR